jgi:hypothetical protein
MKKRTVIAVVLAAGSAAGLFAQELQRMKKIVFLFALLFLSLTLHAQPKPGKPAFVVTYEESGKNVNESWNYSATVKFSLSHWNNILRGTGYTPEERKVPVDFDPGVILKLEPGDKIQFYPSEVDESGSGSHGHYTRVLTPDGTETVTETQESQGTHTIVTSDADYRREHNIPMNEVYNLNARYYQLDELAELERTASGAILRAYTAVGNNLSEWAVSQETMEQVFPKVETFVLTEQDINAWQQISKTNVASGSYDDDNLTVKLSVKMTVATADVTLEGCSELGAGENGNVTATGKPGGGTYEFWVDPSDLMSVDASGASATLIGSRPGRGTLYVEYTAPDGSKAEASKPAAMVRIYNYNGGEAIPPIALYDIDGNKLPGTTTVPYSSEPDEAQELVDFVSGNPAVFTATASADDITLLGIKAGKATLEARDNCGNTTGPTVEVEVVNCDKETVEALERMRKAAVENMQAAAEALQKLAGSEEFEKAMKDIPGAAQKLLAKAALTIITAGKAPTAAIKTAGELAEAGAAISELIGSSTGSELGQNAFKNAVGQLGGELVNTLVGVVEVGEAGYEFGEKLGQILGHESTMKGALENFEQADKNFKEVERLQRICKGNTEEPKKQEPPKTDNPPKPDEPTPTPTEPTPTTKPKPKEDNPPAQEPTGDEPTPDEPGKTEPPDNPPPTTKPTPVALPYQPSDCGCRKQKGIGANSAGIATLGTGIKNLGDCVDRFTKTSVADYSDALTELSELTKSLQTGAGDKPDMFLKQAKEAKPQLDSLILRVRAYDEAGKTFLSEFEKCPESVSAGMDVLKSALTVTVDSISTKY